ncbi:MAG: cupin domain-containing protein [Nanoarchaeota archaeon]|nr:cupin domain-containing protein [Nanoarchaeota archaeon]
MEGVIHKKISPIHEDERRAIIEIFNGGFNAKQLKILKIKKDSILGNHYHHYRQFFYFLKGNSKYTFLNINTNERFEIDIKEGDLIIIDPFIAHKTMQKAGNVIIEGNEEKYISPEVDDIKYEIT